MKNLREDSGFVILEAEVSNTIIISKDWTNGPNENLSNGKNGFLFKNNKMLSPLNQISGFKYLRKDEFNKKRFCAKKKTW